MVEGGSFLSGEDPLKDNIALFLVQVLVILAVSRLIAIPLRYLNQPTVIAEVIGGILLGPSLLSRSATFKEHVFPASSLPRLKLVADFGLILFLFLVGLELDPRKIVKDLKTSASISIAGIVVPFAAGVGVSKVIYDHLADTAKVSFSSFVVFCGVAMSITAFPVLARILTERKLFKTRVGQATLAAAASDDAVAWCLLVLVVALINNPSNSVLALYVFLTVVAWAAFLWIAVRPMLVYLVNKSESNDSVSQTAVLVTFACVCISSWFTQAVGVHAIFGGFLMGMITPHEHGFAIKITEKVEDLVSILFLPLYFAYSGLNFSIDSLNDAFSWGMVVLVIAVACGGKIIGCTGAARYAGLTWRESFTVGILMNTKGLVELIVLNLGLQAGVITTKIFTIFVIMALFTTFMTTPIVTAIFPMRLYIKQQTPSEIGTRSIIRQPSGVTLGDAKNGPAIKVLVCLPSMRTMPAMMNVTQLLSRSQGSLSIIALRIVELSSRLSQIMMAADSSETLRSDAVVNVFRTFGQLNKVRVSTVLAVSDVKDFAHNIISAAVDADADLLIFPTEAAAVAASRGSSHTLVTDIFDQSPCSVGVFVDRGFGVSSAEITDASDKANDGADSPLVMPGANQRILFAFFGGPDDCEAALVVQRLAAHDGVSLTVLVVPSSDNAATADDKANEAAVIEALRAVPGSTIEMLPSANANETVLARAAEFGRKDLIVVGKAAYETVTMTSPAPAQDANGSSSNMVAVQSFKTWLDTTSVSSVMIVKLKQMVGKGDSHAAKSV
ncbi:Sodium/hydrogen exchanger family-domain-containing protein [Entophlyctis helioformis]|nr:Sodium/hydrogen exchanger family-domain-containing protein [Entophlyctis helioformis]